MAVPERIDWTPEEVTATVDSYFQMLKLELAGKNFNKSAENEHLRARLNGRSKAAVEFKHQNISAVLLENGWLYIEGYKPMKNVQAALRNEVERRLRLEPEIDRLMLQSTTSEKIPSFANIHPPEVVKPPELILGTAEWTPRMTGIKRDYVFRDTQNRALGLAGELKVVELEKHQLVALGKPELAARVEHVAVTQGDGLGYDVLSFDASGAERFIEVKTTTHSVETPFFVTNNEVVASDFYGGQFHLHRLFRFTRKAGLYKLRGPIRDNCLLQPTNYLAVPRATS